jgi:hypothetical protein
LKPLKNNSTSSDPESGKSFDCPIVYFGQFFFTLEAAQNGLFFLG